MGVASVILGLTAVVLALIPIGLTQLVGVALGLLGIIVGLMARSYAREHQLPRSRATAGIVLGASGVLLSGLMFASCMLLMDRVGREVERDSAGFARRLGEELKQEFGRRRGSDEFHRALEQVIKRAEREDRLVAPDEKPSVKPPVAPTRR